jgi:DNA polymerase II small subunit/DNA polymerase delta subunit B
MSDLQKVDITLLAQYINKIQELSSVNKMMAPTYLRDMIVGQDVAANLLAKAMQTDSKAKSKVEYAESIAYLERARDYLENRGIKDTSEARKQYVNIDQDVMAAKENRAMTEALVSLLKSKLSQLRQCHDDLKKIAYGDQNMTGYEGM